MKYLMIYENFDKDDYVKQILIAVNDISYYITRLSYIWSFDRDHNYDFNEYVPYPNWFDMSMDEMPVYEWKEKLEEINDYQGKIYAPQKQHYLDEKFQNYTTKEFIIKFIETLDNIKESFLKLKKLKDNLPKEIKWLDIIDFEEDFEEDEYPIYPFSVPITEIEKLVNYVVKWTIEFKEILSISLFKDNIEKSLRNINKNPIN